MILNVGNTSEIGGHNFELVLSNIAIVGQKRLQPLGKVAPYFLKEKRRVGRVTARPACFLKTRFVGRNENPVFVHFRFGPHTLFLKNLVRAQSLGPWNGFRLTKCCPSDDRAIQFGSNGRCSAGFAVHLSYAYMHWIVLFVCFDALHRHLHVLFMPSLEGGPV